MSQPIPALRKTPLNALHRAGSARMVDWAGWEMPAEYGGRVAEHLAVRTAAGLFDQSQHGQIELAGKDALAALQYLASNDLSVLRTGQAGSAVLTTTGGTVVDVVAIHRLAGSHFLLVADAPGAAADVAWIAAQAKRFGDVAVLDTSARYAGVALQGPLAEDVLQGLANFPLGDLEPGWFAHGEVAGVRVTISRTGRVGEDGFELLAPPQGAPTLWTSILREGDGAGVLPVGLVAQDTLRLEAGVRLCGRDLDPSMTPLEAGFDDLVAWDKGDFAGRAALVAERERGVARRIVGIETPEAAAPAGGVYVGGARVGTVTSGVVAPFLKKGIGLAPVPAGHAAPGTACDVDVGGRLVGARVVTLPFYHRSER